MKSFVSFALLALLFIPTASQAQSVAMPATSIASAGTAVTPSDATTRSAQSGELFGRMTRLNAGLKSYKADLHLNVELKTFLPLNQSLDGNVYYKQPDEQAVVFDAVPALASQFKKLYARIEPPDLWASKYAFAVLGDDHGVTTFRLVPRKHGRVSHLDVSVDDATATIKNYVWNYEDGGTIGFDQRFTRIGGNYLVEGQVGHVDLPSYKADVRSSLTNYRLNISIDNDVFKDVDAAR